MALDLDLFPLFCREVASHTDNLARQILSLEDEQEHAETFDNIMRSAHALKGAARVVGLDCIASLMHGFEDLCGLARQQETIQDEHIDSMLQAIDTLNLIASIDSDTLASWLQEHGENIRNLGQHLSNLQYKPIAAPQQPIEQAIHTTPNAEEAPISSQTVTIKEAELSIKRQLMDSMVALAAESQLANRKLLPIHKNLQYLRKKIQQAEPLMQSIREHETKACSDDPAALQQQLSRMQNMHEQLNRWFRELSDQNQQLISHQRAQNKLSLELYDQLILSRMQTFENMVTGLQRMCHDIARQLGKPVKLIIKGKKVLLDRDLIAPLTAPLQQLIRNALDHGIESREERLATGKPTQAQIILEARHSNGLLILKLSDDGKGIDLQAVKNHILQQGLSNEQALSQMSEKELLEFLFLPRFSTRKHISELSGRGAGLDLVANSIRQLHGRIDIEQSPGKGCCFSIQLPLSRSILSSLLIDINGQNYAIPSIMIQAILQGHEQVFTQASGKLYLQYQKQQIPVSYAAKLLEEACNTPAKHCTVLILPYEQAYYALLVDQALYQDRILERPLDPRFGKLPFIAAASLLSNGQLALILDMDDVLQALQQGQADIVTQTQTARKEHQKCILIAEDSETVRSLEQQTVEAQGYRVILASDGNDAWNKLCKQKIDLLITDIDMPRTSGIKLTRMIRKDQQLKKLPIIVVSYKDSPEDCMRGLNAGVDRYLSKANFQNHILMQNIVELIGKADEA